MHFHNGYLRLWRVVVICLIFSAATAAGAEPPRVAVSRFPFGGRIPNSAWSPIFSRLENPTPHTIDAAVFTSVDVGGTGAKANFLRRVRLPPYSERTVEIFVLMDYHRQQLLYEFEESQQDVRFSDGTVRKTTLYRSKPLSFTTFLVDAKTSQQVSKEAFGANPVHPDAVFLALVDETKPPLRTDERYLLRGQPYILGEHPDDLSYMGGGRDAPYSDALLNRNYPLPEDIGSLLQAGHARLDELPVKWAAYEGVDILVLGSLRAADGRRGLTPDQQYSLLRYIRAGGRVVIMPAYDLESYRHPFWEQLLPVRLVGVRPLRHDLASLEQRHGKAVVFDRELPPLMAEALEIPEVAEVYARDGERVLLARRQVGSGDVWFVAFTGAAVEDWSAGHAFWAQVLRPLPNPLPGLRGALAENARTFLDSVVGIPAPSRWLVAVFLGGYFILVCGALAVARRRGRQEMAWPAILALALIGALAAAYISAVNRARVGFIQGELGVTLLGSETPQGGTTSFLGLHAPRDLREDLVWSSPDTLAAAHPDWETVRAGGRPAEFELTVEEGNHFLFPSLMLKGGEIFVARAMTMASFGDGVVLQVGVGPAGPAGHGVFGRVINRTGVLLRDAILRLNRRVLRVGDLPPAAERDLSRCDLSWTLSARDFASDDDKVRRYVLAEALRFPPRAGGMAAERCYEWPVALYAWCDVPQARLKVGKEQPQERAMQLLAVPAVRVETRQEIYLPAGACGIKLLRGGSRTAYGDPLRLFTFENLRLGREDRIAGMQRPHAEEKKPPPLAEDMPQPNEAPLDPAEKFRATGWTSDNIPTTINVAFPLPDFARKLRAKRLWLVVDADARGLVPRVGIRRAGQGERAAFAPLDLQIGKGRLRYEIPRLAEYLGPQGELPEFQLEFQLPADAAMGASVRWTVREFDVEVEGILPAEDKP